MKKYRQLFDIVLLVSLSLASVTAIMPKAIVMTTAVQMMFLTIVIGLIAAFLVLLWRERPDDERELQNQALASRMAYIVGSLVLIVALIIQSLNHQLDPVIPIALLAMIATKIILQRVKDGS